jgi:Xaa-Pro aminopeptidase
MEASVSITRSEFDARAGRLLRYMQGENLSGVVLFDPSYILYFTGFAFAPTERPIAFVMNREGEKAMFVPRLEVEHAQRETGFERVDHYVEYPYRPHPMEVLKDTLADMGISDSFGADSDGYPWILGYRGPALSELTGARYAQITAFVEDLMAIKSEAEIALIRESCKWGNLAHRLLQRYTAPGETETEVSMRASDEATLAMLDTLGALYRAQSWFSSGASAGYRGQIGRRSAWAHAVAHNIVFRDGDVLVSETSAPVWGYNAELERAMIIGKPTDEMRRLFGHMVSAQQIAFHALRPGVTCADVDGAVMSYFEENDLLPYWRQHTGHAIGLRNHEAPFLDIGDPTPIEPGMVFTIEPGLYAEDIGGFRHSDTVVVTPDGIDILTYYPRDIESLTVPV